MPNSQYERDFNDLGALKRPGRLDFKTLNNVDNAGDGHPGLQKAIRNYFHEGYLEKDINMNTHKITNLQTPTSNNDGARKVDVDTVQTDLNTHKANDGSDHSFIDQAVTIASTPTFGSLTITNNITVGGTVDGINISNIRLNSMPSVADGDIDANTQKIINVVDPTTNQGVATKKWVDDHNWVEANITDLDKYDQATINAFTLNKWAVPTADISMNTHKITGVVDPVNNQDVATKNFVKNYLPIGTILMYNGIGWVDNSTILGWWKCDGNNGTPNLVNKFIRSEASSSNEGGSDDAIVVQHNHGASSANAGIHDHNIKTLSVAGGYTGLDATVVENVAIAGLIVDFSGEHNHNITVGNEGVSGVDKNIPTFYSLIFIMRVS